MSSARQLTLPFPYHPRYTAADFLPACSNDAALAWLDRTADWPDGRLLLWGDAGRGKTHLLHIWADQAHATIVCGASLRGLPMLPEHGIAVDNADLVIDEKAFFHLLNAAREAGRPVLLAAREPPSRWAIRLPDLASRLRSITAVEIGPPEDSLMRALLARLFSDRQLAVPAVLQDRLLLRLPRTPDALRHAVGLIHETGTRIDRAMIDALADTLAESGVT